MSASARFLETFEKESATTMKVLRAYPPDQASLKPHERSKTALDLAWTFVIEQRMLIKALTNQMAPGGFPDQPQTWEGVVDAFEKGVSEVAEHLRDAKNTELEGTVPFYVAPKQLGEVPRAQFVWFMLHDQIHHRGQLSVYLRMAGGKVPSIYGPTADEPWR